MNKLSTEGQPIGGKYLWIDRQTQQPVGGEYPRMNSATKRRTVSMDECGWIRISPEYAHLWITVSGPVHQDLHHTSRAAILRIRSMSLLPKVTVYGGSANGFNRFCQINLCGLSPDLLNVGISRVRGREAANVISFTRKPLSYHQPNLSCLIINTGCGQKAFR